MFYFPNGVETDDGYKQVALYFVIMGVVIFEIIIFIFRLIKNCRLNNKTIRTILPIVPLIILLLYGIVYVIDYDLIAFIAGDMKAVNVYAVVFTLEICITVGFLPSNTKYEELFMASSLSQLIIDKDYNPLLSSNSDVSIPYELLKKSNNETIKLDNDKYLFNMPLSIGYVLWLEDVSEISSIIYELEELDKELEGKNLVLKEEYETRHKKLSLIEKNRLYDQMQKQSKEKIMILEKLINDLKNCKDKDEINNISLKIAVITAYLKRRNNLIFISEENGAISSSELSYCLKESLINLSLFKGSCDLNVDLKKELNFLEITTIYDMFELVCEAIVTNFDEVFVYVTGLEDCLYLRMSIVCDCDLTKLTDYGFNVDRESENEYSIEYCYKKVDV